MQSGTDRYVRVVRLSIIALPFTIAIGVMCVAVITLWIVAHQAATEPQDERSPFRRIVGVSPDKFSDIRYFSAGGEDGSWHCRFRFSRPGGLWKILEVNRLTKSDKVDRTLFLRSWGINVAECPDWYDLQEASSETVVYKSQGDTDYCALYVDNAAGVAYFEVW